MRTSTRTSARKLGASNQNLLLSNALVAARTHILGSVLLAVIRDVLL
jgi:hypothetical protein